jgi:UDP-N-acetylmuramate dehydrogenase
MEWKGIRGAVLKDVPMRRYTSMKVGGPVKYLVYPLNEGDLINVLRLLKERGIKYRFVGNGTNIIVNDKGINEALIRITRIKYMRHKKTKNGTLAETSGGTSLKGFIKDIAHRGLSGLEKLFWIPGTIGGALKMNAGSFGSSITDVLENIRIVDADGKITSIAKKDMAFGYRASPIKVSECVLGAQFHLKDRDKREIYEDMEYVYAERKKRHPMEFPSSGSIFKGVEGKPAWKFIEKTGLKGFRYGDACVSEKHANFIVNLGSATAKDIKMLIDKIKKEVYEKEGVLLKEEVELWGFNG